MVKQQVRAVTSKEVAMNSTYICCINAVCELIPQMLIYKRTSMSYDFKKGDTPNINPSSTVQCLRNRKKNSSSVDFG